MTMSIKMMDRESGISMPFLSFLGTLAPSSGLARTGVPKRYQTTPQQVQVGQGEGGEQTRGVLRQPSVANFIKSPQTLNDVKSVLTASPRSEKRLGDTFKIGRRGSLGGRLTVHGIQGDVAYPNAADNPVHALAPALAELVARTSDKCNAPFQPTTFQVSNIAAGTGAPNVIPGELKGTIQYPLLD